MEPSGMKPHQQSTICIDITDKNTGHTLPVEVPAEMLVAALQRGNPAARNTACGEICRAFGVQLQAIHGEDPHLLIWSDIQGSITTDLSLRQLSLNLAFGEPVEEHPSLFDHLPSTA